ncbi:MAG: hypothetical protein GY813_05330, partial [Halieaceae bacterium]|nr:hypothetical protein [Halieaceae bacterium]
VTVLEMHGTGTPLGDPIEVGAAGAVLWTDRRAPLVWAAAKSAVGHAEPGAGLVGLLNAATMLSHRVGKQIMHLRSINPHVEGVLGLSKLNAVPREMCSLTPSGESYVCGALSSFAFQGTNAHSTFNEVGSATLKWKSSSLFSRSLVSVLRFKNALCQSVSSQPISTSFSFDVKNAFLSEHVVFGQSVFPGTGYFEVIRAAILSSVKDSSISSGHSICNLSIAQPLVMSGNSAVFPTCTLTNDGVVKVVSQRDGGANSTTHINASVRSYVKTGSVVMRRPSSYSPHKTLPATKNSSTISNISIEDVLEEQCNGFHIPPNVLDCCLQTAQFLRRSGSTFVPTGMDACA